MHVERILPANERAVLAYLSRAPYDNVFLSHLVLADRSSVIRDGLFVAMDDGNVVGAAYFGRQIVLACEPRALGAFADVAQRRRGERMIVGPRDTVAALWRLLRDRRPPPRLVRDRQLVMAVDRATLRAHPGVPALIVRPARANESTAVTESSAQMIESELGYDPRRTSPDFASGVRAMIEREAWWVAQRGDALCFFCSIGPWCEHTMQLQGIWTPPPMRGRGFATAALTAICDRLLEVSPTLSLYVNDFNERAIGLYRRVGFAHVSDFQTILF